ncbi:diacylglycerol/lipid kinase family protein [Pontibacter harenae]|uniref:diacylglycerol/lipid kinase family protein n=1 Tax=Pontibacter harenae TaxID=2894083 RepID=UPI001E59A0E6|nr:diacylglycerol kinase family protein [Pontibacter harenae]MCC9167626.1 hypothetical protein [Pontibacter harenae]
MNDEPSIRHLLFVINPIAGDIDKEELEDSIAEVCSSCGISYEVYKTTGKNDKEVLQAKLKQTRFDGVFAVGGDGTVNLVASLLLKTDIPMGIIPLGSGNGLSKDLGIPQDVEEALDLMFRHEVQRIDTLELNGVPSIHLSDIGFNALVVKRFCEGERRGPGAYAWIALQEYLNYVPKRYRIETDVETYEGEAFMVTIANANAFGSNAAINPKGIVNDGKFEICLIEPFPKAAAIGIMIKLYTDSIDESVYTRRLICKQATIYNLDNEVVHVDGEPIDTAQEIKVVMHTQSLKVFLPVPDEEE